MSFAHSFRSLFLGATLTLSTFAFFDVSLFAAPPETIRKAEEAEPTGDEILAMVRMSRALQQFKSLTGKLRNDDKDGREYPLELTMTDNVIRFLFTNPNEVINLDVKDTGTKLRRVVNGANTEIPSALYGESIRGTAINYEDVSMRFLYWPNAKIIGEDTVTYMKCWIVRVVNPDGRGPYSTVDVWIHKESGAVAQMYAYDDKGRKMKVFTVRKGQKFQGAYILKQMRIESYNVETNKINGRTYLEINDPK